MQKLLSINENPMLKTYNSIAFPLGILSLNKNFSEKYILRNFNRLCCTKLWPRVMVNKKFFIFWGSIKCKKIFHIKKQRLLNYIENAILNGYYIFLKVNEKYIPERKAYQKYNHANDIYIFGFDNDKKEFHTIQYCNNDGSAINIYKRQILSYNTVFESYNKSAYKYNFDAYAFKAKENFNFDKLNISEIKKDIHAYLNSKNKRYGINVYDILIDKYSRVSANERISLIDISMLKEHKWILSLVGKYFLEYKVFSYEFICVQNSINNIFLLAILYDKTLKRKYLESLIENLKKIREKEKEILSNYFLDEVKKDQ
jgi:hypothetical protein